MCWNRRNPRSFTLGLLDAALGSTPRLGAQGSGSGRSEASELPVIDTALALGRL
jgi:hypothetical protein